MKSSLYDLINITMKEQAFIKSEYMNNKRRKIPFVHVNIGFFADHVGQTPSNTFDGSKSEHNLLLSIDVCVEHTQYVLEIFVRYQRLKRR